MPCMYTANNIRTQQTEDWLYNTIGNGQKWQTYNANGFTSSRNELESLNDNLNVPFWYICVRPANHGL